MWADAALFISICLCIVSAFFLGYYTGFDRGFSLGWFQGFGRRMKRSGAIRPGATSSG